MQSNHGHRPNHGENLTISTSGTIGCLRECFRGVSLQKQLATTSLIVRFTGPLGLAFFFVSKGSALKVAVVGTVVWLVLLEIFFVGIWPSL